MYVHFLIVYKSRGVKNKKKKKVKEWKKKKNYTNTKSVHIPIHTHTHPVLQCGVFIFVFYFIFFIFQHGFPNDCALSLLHLLGTILGVDFPLYFFFIHPFLCVFTLVCGLRHHYNFILKIGRFFNHFKGTRDSTD